jgi:hypothetical protein
LPGRTRTLEFRKWAGLTFLVQQVKLLAWLEADGFAGGDADLGAGSGITADTGLPGLDGEDAKAAKFDPVAGHQGLLHALEDGIDGSFGLGPGKPGPFDDALDEILLDQERVPFSLWRRRLSSRSAADAKMVEILLTIVNGIRVP